ncbi:hypothetical protein ABW19_dt0203689 [Dactylella cylindrospora]|nr:hypothetical protein ABW19_dt0203689 [Dactylella cylindrospora]
MYPSKSNLQALFVVFNIVAFQLSSQVLASPTAEDVNALELKALRRSLRLKQFKPKDVRPLHLARRQDTSVGTDTTIAPTDVSTTDVANTSITTTSISTPLPSDSSSSSTTEASSSDGNSEPPNTSTTTTIIIPPESPTAGGTGTVATTSDVITDTGPPTVSPPSTGINRPSLPPPYPISSS